MNTTMHLKISYKWNNKKDPDQIHLDTCLPVNYIKPICWGNREQVLKQALYKRKSASIFFRYFSHSSPLSPCGINSTYNRRQYQKLCGNWDQQTIVSEQMSDFEFNLTSCIFDPHDQFCEIWEQRENKILWPLPRCDFDSFAAASYETSIKQQSKWEWKRSTSAVNDSYFEKQHTP